MVDRALLLDTGKEALERSIRPISSIEFVRLRASDLRNKQGDEIGFLVAAETAAYLDRLMASRPFQQVVASSESHIQFAGWIRSRYGLAGPGHDQAASVSNKWVMRRTFSGYAQSPRHWLSGTFLEMALADMHDLPESVVIKPLYGSSSSGVRKMSQPDAIAFIQGQKDLFLIEEAVDIEQEWHCDGILFNGQLIFRQFSRYSKPILAAAGGTVASMHIPEMHPFIPIGEDFVRATLQGLSVNHGVFHLEFYLSRGECILGEIALRPAGGGIAESLLKFRGVDLWESFVRIQLGLPVTSPQAVPLTGYCGVIGFVAAPGQVERNALSALPGVVAVKMGKSEHGPASGALGASAFTDLVLCSYASEEEFNAAVNRLSLPSA